MFERYPFLLPNLVCVSILGCGLIVGLLFLQETHAEHKHKRDWGVELSVKLFGKFVNTRQLEQEQEKGQAHTSDEVKGLLENTSYSNRNSEAGSTRPSLLDVRLPRPSPMGARKAFTWQVIMNVVAYGVIA